MQVQGDQLRLELTSSSFTKVLFATIKVGIVKSNLIAMFAGLSMALLVNHISFMDKIGSIVLAFIGSTLVIGAAGAFNNLYDRDIDGIMERTKKRPTVTGQVGTGGGLVIGVGMSLIGLLALYFASPMSALFGFLGLFIYVVPYTMWTKRRTIYNTEVGSLSGAMPPLIGWAAISSDMMNSGILALFLLMLIWQMPHFYAIAIRRMEEYRAAGIPMLPVVKGMRRTYLQMNAYLVLQFACSALFWTFNPFVAIVNAVLSLVWLAMSIVGYRRKPESKWAQSMFILSLNHMTIVMLFIVGYSLFNVFF